ncbi:EexN family lipoprotein [Rhizorhabdus argentea]|uniref:EexN family lipoprotein n=1 Tax=Rhizorhabdus argentea TaxID=1387174 RepID=UPI003BF616D0
MVIPINRLVGLFLLEWVSACSGGAEPPHNAKYYSDNSNARAEMLRRCSKDQNSENPMNCVAAQDAQLVAIGGK